MTQLDPNDFIITRKRKKYKFAKFHNAKNCFEFSEWTKRAADIVEIGAGNGMFAVEQAALQPDKIVVAIDVKGDRLQKGAYEALARGLTNVFFVRARADQITELFSEHTASEIWLTFSDPFPKKRSAGRRLTHPHFLSHYQKVLSKDGALCIKHDNNDFFCWSLEQLVVSSWRIVELTFDLHASSMNGLCTIMTAYETRWINEGRKTMYLRAIPLQT